MSPRRENTTDNWEELTMNVPFVDLQAQHRTIRDELNQAMRRVMERADFALGKDVACFEEEFATFCGTRWMIVSSSCGSTVSPRRAITSARTCSLRSVLPLAALGGGTFRAASGSVPVSSGGSSALGEIMRVI